VTAGLAVLLVAVPALALPRRPGQAALDRFWELLTCGVLLWIAVVYALESVRDFEPLTVAAAGALGVIAARAVGRRRGRPHPPRPAEAERGGGAQGAAGAPASPAPEPVPLGGLLLEAMDPGLLRRCRAALRAGLGRAGAALRGAAARLGDPAAAIGVLALLAAYALRLRGPLLQAAPGTSDTYVHLLWTNLLLHSQLFPQGAYPMGMHAVAAVTSAVCFEDPLTVLRFLGPLDGLLLVLGVYALAGELSGSRLGAAVAALVFGLGTASPLPEAAFRQINPLPQEFAAVFVPVALLYAVRYLRTGDRAALALCGAAFTAGGLIHPYAPAFAGLVVACLAGAAAVLPGAGRRRAAPLLGAAAAGTALGLVPLAAAHLAGIPFYASSAAYVVSPSGGAAPARAGLPSLIRGNPYLEAGLLFAAGAVAAALGGRRDPGRRPLLLGFGAAVAAMYALLAAALAQAPLVPAVPRTSEFLSIVLVPAAAGLLFGGPLADPSRRGAAALLAAALVVPGVALWPPRFPQPDRFEPEGAARTFLRIRDAFTVRQWTIVSPVEQYSEAVGRGWHVELNDFVRRFSVGEAADPGFLLENAGPGAIQTPDVFIYVETTPLGSDLPLSAADLALPLPTAPGPAVYQGQGRAAIEARAYAWCLAYMRSHPADTQVYYRDAGFEVFHIHQE
jgi:hypothetical protein